MGVLLAMIALTLVYAGVLARFGTPDWGPIYSGYLGLVLLAGALVSIGLADLRAHRQPDRGRGRLARRVRDAVGDRRAGRAAAVADSTNWVLGLSLLARFTPFAVGAMYASDFGFFLAVTLLGLFLAVRGAGAALTRWSTPELDWNALLWVGGWLGAVLVLFAAGLRLPLQTGLAGWRARAYSAGSRRWPRSASRCWPTSRCICTTCIST